MADDNGGVPTSRSEFQKKYFTPRALLRGAARFTRNIPALRRAKHADRVSDQFAEKIMLAVTSVNECQYCSRFHTDLARDVGVDEATIASILERDIDTAVEDDELPALVFAQQYAEADESPGQEAHDALVDAYGSETAVDILAFVRAIYFGNLLGNTYDATKFTVRRAVHGWTQQLRRAKSAVTAAFERVRSHCPV